MTSRQEHRNPRREIYMYDPVGPADFFAAKLDGLIYEALSANGYNGNVDALAPPVLAAYDHDNATIEEIRRDFAFAIMALLHARVPMIVAQVVADDQLPHEREDCMTFRGSIFDPDPEDYDEGPTLRVVTDEP